VELYSQFNLASNSVHKNLDFSSPSVSEEAPFNGRYAVLHSFIQEFEVNLEGVTRMRISGVTDSRSCFLNSRSFYLKVMSIALFTSQSHVWIETLSDILHDSARLSKNVEDSVSRNPDHGGECHQKTKSFSPVWILVVMS